MTRKTLFLIGIVGVSLFSIASILGGLLIENYSIVSQYISETYAIDTEYGLVLRIFGHFPAGVLFTVFSFKAVHYFPTSKLVKIGFYGIGIFYGIGTILVAIFPCDSGCNKEFINPSIAQIIHNLSAVFVYTLVPLSIFLIGLGLSKISKYNRVSIIALVLGSLSMVFVYILMSDPNSGFLGVYQRIIELLFIIWILTSAFKIKNTAIK